MVATIAAEKVADQRWCKGGAGRYSENGVVGAEQADESYFDDRSVDSEATEDGKGRIKFSQRKLYGRENDLARCQAMYESMLRAAPISEEKEEQSTVSQHQQGSPKVAFVTGYSGCGKSALVESFTTQLATKNKKFTYLSAKYEAMQNNTPFSALGSLFDNVEMTETNKVKFQNLRHCLHESLGDDAASLTKIFPGLKSILGIGNDGNSINSCDSDSRSRSLSAFMKKTKLQKSRLHFALQSLFRALCSVDNPLILFVDDLQWIDDQSLEFLETLLTDEFLNYLFFFGAYRSNEVDDDHKLSKVMMDIADKNPGLQEIELVELSSSDIGEFIADTLRLDPDEVQTLTGAIFTKTLGNPFFTMQALEQLVRKNALYYDTISFSWSWKLEREQLEELISDDIIEMVKSKIRHMSKDMQNALVVASYTRATFDVETLLELLDPEIGHPSNAAYKTMDENPRYAKKKQDLISMLQHAAEEGLLVSSSSQSLEYSFAHDRIQEAASGFISDDDRDAFLTRIGNTLLRRASSAEGEDWMSFAAARHLNSVAVSSPDIDNNEARMKLASLNLHTAELSLELLSFSGATEFVANGIKNLPTDMWASQYQLALKLHSVGAEAEYGSGNVEKAEFYCNEVLKLEKNSVSDRIPVFKVHLDVLAGKGKKPEAFRLTMSVLEELGVKFPAGQHAQRLKAFMTLKQIKARYIPTEEAINNMPHASDPAIIDTMELLLKAGSFAFASDEVTLYVLMCCESIRLMNKHGLTDGSASAMASFANVLMHVYDDFDTSARIAELAVLITNRLKNKFNETRALNTANNNVLGWVRPLRTRLKYHVRATESGLVSGNIEGAYVGKWFAFWVQLYSAMPLAALEAECRITTTKLRKLGLHFYANLGVIVWQISLNLMGKSEHTVLVKGEAMDEASETYSKMPFKMIFSAWRSYLYVIFGDFEAGAEDALLRGDSYTKKMIGMMYGFETFLRGMSLYAMARKGVTKYKSPAQKVLKQLKTWVKKGCVNLSGVTKLLEGEDAVISKKKKLAYSLFEDAIAVCTQGEFHQFAGLSCERYAICLQENGDVKAASRQISKAIEHYTRWGAFKKVELLKKRRTNEVSETAPQ